MHGDLGPEYYNGRGHAHSADISVEAWHGPSHHLRIDIESSVDYGKTNIRRPGGIQAHLTHVENDCRTQHGLSEVTPFVAEQG